MSDSVVGGKRDKRRRFHRRMKLLISRCLEFTSELKWHTESTGRGVIVKLRRRWLRRGVCGCERQSLADNVRQFRVQSSRASIRSANVRPPFATSPVSHWRRSTPMAIESAVFMMLWADELSKSTPSAIARRQSTIRSVKRHLWWMLEVTGSVSRTIRPELRCSSSTRSTLVRRRLTMQLEKRTCESTPATSL